MPIKRLMSWPCHLVRYESVMGKADYFHFPDPCWNVPNRTSLTLPTLEMALIIHLKIQIPMAHPSLLWTSHSLTSSASSRPNCSGRISAPCKYLLWFASIPWPYRNASTFNAWFRSLFLFLIPTKYWTPPSFTCPFVSLFMPLPLQSYLPREVPRGLDGRKARGCLAPINRLP